jgi:hypothetical protein
VARHPKNKTGYKGLDKLAADPRVAEIIGESGRDGDGIWVYLVSPFWCDYLETSFIHEWTVGDVLDAVGSITAANSHSDGTYDPDTSPSTSLLLYSAGG